MSHLNRDRLPSIAEDRAAHQVHASGTHGSSSTSVTSAQQVEAVHEASSSSLSPSESPTNGSSLYERRRTRTPNIDKAVRLVSDNVAPTIMLEPDAGSRASGVPMSTLAASIDQRFREANDFETARRSMVTSQAQQAFARVREQRASAIHPEDSSGFDTSTAHRPTTAVGVVSPTPSAKSSTYDHSQRRIPTDVIDCDWERAGDEDDDGIPAPGAVGQSAYMDDEYSYQAPPEGIDPSDPERNYFWWAQFANRLRAKRWSESRVCAKIHEKVANIVKQHSKSKSKRATDAADPLQSEAFAILYDHFHFIRMHPAPLADKVKMFPHFVAVCRQLSMICTSANAWDRAVQLHSHALDLMVACVRQDNLYGLSDMYVQWELLRDTVRRSPSLSTKGALQFFENKVTAYYTTWVMGNRKPDDPAMVLMKRIRADIITVRERRFEKWGNLLFIYLLFFMLMFMAVRCFYESSCDASPQLVTVDEASYATIPMAFDRITIYPRCASNCGFPFYNLVPQCTCDPDDLDCSGSSNVDNPPAGDKCFCRRPVCDSCSVCGRVRSLLRNYIFWIFFFATILDSILFVLSLVAVDYPNPPLEGVPALDLQFYANRTQALRDCALIIPHYGPSGPIEASLKYALQLFPPDKIYVCHNGPSNAPMDRAGKLLDTYNCVKRVSQWYREQTGRMDAPDINYTWTSEGSKSASIFEGVLFASREKYVCVMDNDCLLPKDLSIPTILMERKDRVHALAFVIRAANFYCADGKRNLWPAYQDLEYKKAALAKLFQAQMATCLFAHGAVASWRRETLSSVMLRHNGNFYGDDLQMGLILQKFNKSYRMKAVGSVNVPTICPSHFFCCPWNTPQAKKSGKSWFNRMLCAPYRCNAWGCAHEEKSLFTQRARSWEVANQRMIWDQLKLLLFYWNRAVLILKPYLLYEAYCVLQDYLRIPLLLYVFLSWQRTQMFLQMVALFSLLSLFLHALMELWTFRRRQELRSGMFIAISYLFYNNVLLLTRWLGLVYNLFVFLPRTRLQPKMKNRPQLPQFIDGKFVSTDNRNPRPPKLEELEKLHEDVRINPFVRGAKRTIENDGWLILQWDGERWVLVDKIMDKNPLNTVPRRQEVVSDMEAQSYLFFIALLVTSFFLAYHAESTTTTALLILIGFAVVLSVARIAYK